jgi:predicted PP-loop superfamily ATPase
MSEESIKARMKALEGNSAAPELKTAEKSESNEKVRLQVYVPRILLKKLRHVIADEGGNLSSAVEAMLWRELAKRP